MKEIKTWWNYKIARELYHSKQIVDKANFDLIYWKGMGKLMRK